MESMKNQHGMQHTQKSEENNPNHSLAMYKRFALMAVAMFVAMYFIMYAMIDGLQDIAKGVFVPVSSLPQSEPRKGVQTA